jgi:hypothetical protein
VAAGDDGERERAISKTGTIDFSLSDFPGKFPTFYVIPRTPSLVQENFDKRDKNKHR